jgi:hypothetical protein
MKFKQLSGVISAQAAIAKQLQSNPANVHCFLIPILKPYLFADTVEVTEQSLLQCLKSPVRCILLKIINLLF